MKFSIIITTYNQPQYLTEAVESCFNQTYKEPFEVIIIDDFSNSCATVNIPDRSEINLLYVKNDKNLGLAKSHNIGVYYSTGEFIIRLDHDDKLKHISEVLVENRLHSEQYTQKWVREGNNPQYWKNLIFNRALQRRPDLWVEGRQQTIMQTSGSHLWRSETEFINNFLKTQSNMLNGLDIGCSNKKKINFAVGIDQDRNGGKTPELVWDGTKELPFRDGTLDFICASHCIEHIKDPVQAIQDWGNKLRTGGFLLLIIPHKKYIPNMGTPDGDPTHVADYLPQDFLNDVLHKIPKLVDKWKIISFDRIQNSWSFDCFLEKM